MNDIVATQVQNVNAAARAPGFYWWRAPAHSTRFAEWQPVILCADGRAFAIGTGGDISQAAGAEWGRRIEP